MKRRVLLAIATLTVLGIVGAAVVAGSHGSSSEKSSSASRVAEPAPAPVADNSAGAAVPGGNGVPQIDLTQAKRPDAQVIHTGVMSIEAKNAGAAARRATDLVRRSGGDVFSSNAADGSEHVVFTVPPAQFDAVMDALRGVGKVTSSATSTDDVTGRAVDLDARLAAARTSAQRLRDLLAHSGNVTDLLQVEQALSARESEVESLDGQRAALAARVDNATITVDFTSTAAPPAAHHASHIPGFLAGLRTGAAAAFDTVLVIATGLGFALPFLPLALVALIVYMWARRHRRAMAPTV
jgi:hypothetical protein